MEKFISLDGEKIKLNGEVELKGICENDDGLYELCDKNDDRAFFRVKVVYENGNYYVDYNEVSEWADSNIIIGRIELK